MNPSVIRSGRDVHGDGLGGLAVDVGAAGSVQFVVDGTSSGSPAALDAGARPPRATRDLAVGTTPSWRGSSAHPTSVRLDGATASDQVVGQASTTTSITATSPASTVVGQGYAVSVSVAAVAPGAGVPTGVVDVTDSDGNSCQVTLSGGSGSCQLPSIASGTKTLDALYEGDASFATSGATEVTHDVGAADTTATVVSSANPSAFGQDVTFTATVATNPASGAVPAGLVQFKVDGTDLGAQVVLDGTGHATIHTADLTVGDHIVQVFYAGTSNFNPSNGVLFPEQHVGAGVSATTILSVTPDPTVTGQNASVSVKVVAVAPAVGIPTGTVTISDADGSCPAVLDASGSGGCDLPSTSAGTKSVQAHYSGDAGFSASDAPSVQHQVNAAPTTTSVDTDVNPSLSGQTVTFTATVSANDPSAAVPAGSVQFAVDGTNSGSPVALDAGGQASIQLGDLAVGDHTVVAQFLGTADFGGSQGTLTPDQAVDQASTATAITGTAPAATVVGQGYAVSVSVAPVAPGVGVPTGTVHVTDSDGSACDVTLNGGSGSCLLPSSSAGSKTLHAGYSGDGNFTGSSATPASHAVTAAGTTTSVASSLNPSALGDDVTFTATVTSNPPSVATVAGAVQFSIDGTNFGSPVTLDGSGHASVHTATLSVGDHTVTAAFVASADFGGSSAALAPVQHVSAGASATTIVSDTPDPSVTGQSYTVSVHVAAVAPAFGTPTGLVTVGDSDGHSCPVTLDGSGNGSCQLLSGPAGAKTITAHYAGDSSFSASDAASAAHQVNATPTTTTVTSNLNPSVFGQSITFTATVSANAPSTAVPTGSVQFVVDGSNSGVPVALDAGGQASASRSDLGAGSHTVVAQFLGSTNFNASQGTLTPNQTVNKASTSISITSETPDPSVTGQTVTVHYSVTVNGAGAGTPTGNVTLVSDVAGTPSCTGTVAAGQCTMTLPFAGTHHLTAAYTGDANFNGSASTPVDAHGQQGIDDRDRDDRQPRPIGRRASQSWSATRSRRTRPARARRPARSW